MTSIAICIAAYNRKERTLACLENLFSSDLPKGAELRVHLLDDASTDGTACAIAERFPQVCLHKGNGNCFWAGGMRVAYQAALAETHSFYIWLNDDVILFKDTIRRAIEASISLANSGAAQHLIVGATCAVDLKTLTYSGYRKASHLYPWRFERIPPHEDRCRECDTVNGNFLLIPGVFAQKLGGISKAYVQMHADFDMGIRSKKCGGKNFILSGFAGICSANTDGRVKFLAPGLSLRRRIALMETPLGYPLRPNITYAANFGVWFPVVILAPYLGVAKAFALDVVKKVRKYA